jgi:hypothetical protein
VVRNGPSDVVLTDRDLFDEVLEIRGSQRLTNE